MLNMRLMSQIYRIKVLSKKDILDQKTARLCHFRKKMMKYERFRMFLGGLFFLNGKKKINRIRAIMIWQGFNIKGL